MSLARAVVVVSQLILHERAMTPPHKTPHEGRFKTKWESFIQLTPFVFYLQGPMLYITCALELLTISHYHLRSSHDSSDFTSSLFCPSSSPTGRIPYLSVTPITHFGILLIAFGTFYRMRCYQALGSLFTFGLCVKPEHQLVTSGPYSFVRHPSYLGLLCITAGMTFVGMTRGSWIIECVVGPDKTGAMFAAYCACISWWAYTAAALYVRAVAEDEQMKNTFGEEWERYAMKVRYWFVPGLA